MTGLLVAAAVFIFSAVLGIGSLASAILTVSIGCVFMIVHGSIAFGPRNLAMFTFVALAVSFASEAVGVATGWVFGSYHYSDGLGPKLLGVPLVVLFAYVSMGYASVVIGRAIIGVRAVRSRSVLPAALASACVMVAWDLAMDPYQSTVSGNWIWHDGGIYFGVPLHNYAGWFFTVFTFMLLYHTYAARNPEVSRRDLIGDQAGFWSMPIAYYALVGLGIVITPFIGGAKAPEALGVSLSLVALFGMEGPAVFALLRTYSGRAEPSRILEREI